jgi:two-component system cell cycle sensor histidine kinase/response regulator CckA
MEGTYNAVLVVLSVIVAILASFAALDLAGRIRSDSGSTRFGWIAGGAAVMGLGIWSMHFVGMLAFHLPIPVRYDFLLMLLSMAVAIAASLLALYIINKPRLTVTALVPGGVLMGVAIAGMHYIGMASMRPDVHLSYDWAIVLGSILIAIVASLTALWLAFTFRSDTSARGTLLKMLSAVVMGFAIAGMHYTGMASAQFAPHHHPMGSGQFIVATGELGRLVFVISIVMIVLALIGAVIDRRMQKHAAFTTRLGAQAVRLGKSEQQYRLLFDSNPNPMWVTDAGSGAFLAVNKAAISAYGFERDEFLTMGIADLRVLRETTFEGAAGGNNGGQLSVSDERVHRKKSGARMNVEVNSQEIVFDGRSACLTLAIDVTDRTTAEEALRQSEQRYRQLFEHLPIGLYSSTPDGRLIDANPQMVGMLGYPDRESLLAVPAPALYVEPDDRLRWRDQMQRHGFVQDFDVRMRRRDGTVIWARDTTRAGSDGSGSVVLYEGVLKDITDQVEAERRLQVSEDHLRQALKMEAVGQLAGGIAHDFNNLLTVIMSYGSMLIEQLPPDDSNRADVQEIIGAADRAAGLTRQLLAFSRKQVLQPRIVHINTVVGDLKSMLDRLIGEDIELKTDLDPAVARINADPGQLEQILMNLVVNARDAMPNGGRLTISTSNHNLSARSTAGALGAADGEYVMVGVSDTGTGMTHEIQQRLFDPFFTTKEKGRGTGLGLSTVYGIVKQSGGEICVYSEPEHGSCFKVYFPRFMGVAEEETPDVQPADIPRGSETIMLVEDDANLRALAVRVLKSCGYDVLVAPGGREALAIAADPRQRIQGVITDLVMPEMSGRELVEQLGAERPEIRFLLMSGYTDDDVVRRGVQKGDTAFLQKPFTPVQLATKVREVLDRALN